TIVSAAAVPTSKLPRNAVRNTSKPATIVETPGPPAVTTATRSNTLNAITSCSTAAATTVGATTGPTTDRSVRHQPAPSSAAASHSSAGTPSSAAYTSSRTSGAHCQAWISTSVAKAPTPLPSG